MPPALVLMQPELYPVHFEAPTMARLRHLCTVVEPVPCVSLDDPQIETLRGDIEIVVTGWGSPRLAETALRRLPRLRLIAHTAGSVKSMIAPEILGSGVRVTHAAAANAIPVAEFTLATILLSNKRVPYWTEAYRRARTRLDKKTPEVRGHGNFGRTVGIVGASRVGRLVIGMLARHDLTVLLADPYVTGDAAAALGARLVGLDALLAASDIVSLHMPLLPETQKCIGARQLAAMRDGALLINTARGAVVDHAALEAELLSGRLDAVLDVTDPEPLPPDSPLWDLPNVILTPHIAGSIGNETRRMTATALDEIERFIRGEPLQHEVDLENWVRAA